MKLTLVSIKKFLEMAVKVVPSIFTFACSPLKEYTCEEYGCQERTDQANDKCSSKPTDRTTPKVIENDTGEDGGDV